MLIDKKGSTSTMPCIVSENRAMTFFREMSPLKRWAFTCAALSCLFLFYVFYFRNPLQFKIEQQRSHLELSRQEEKQNELLSTKIEQFLEKKEKLSAHMQQHADKKIYDFDDVMKSVVNHHIMITSSTIEQKNGNHFAIIKIEGEYDHCIQWFRYCKEEIAMLTFASYDIMQKENGQLLCNLTLSMPSEKK